ncbi:MAG: methyl-accepting chemotaxis protein [Candidatus Omnitrophota bacterium]
MNNHMHEKRKIRIVRMKFQRNFILKFCAIMILSSLIITAIVYGLSASSVTTVFENSRLTIKSTADFILPLLILSSLVAIVVGGIITISVTLFISHRIAGPLYRLEHDITEVGKGNLSIRIYVRKKDELNDLVGFLNQMIDSIRKIIVDVNTELTGISVANISGNAQQKLENAKNLLKKFRC